MEKDNSGGESTELQANWVDYSTAALRAALSPFPIIGPFLAEAFTVAIPQQRMDRFAKWAAEIDGILKQQKIAISEAILKNEEFADLLEEGGRQAVRSLSDERRRYIAQLVTNGLNGEGIETSESKHLLRILGELSDVEVIWLCYHKHLTFGGHQEYWELHKTVLEPAHAFLGSNPEERGKAALQRSYKEHLTQLDLLTKEFRVDYETKMPEFDRSTGAMKVSHYNITNLGELLLREIGLSEDV